jgi:hypothetical protein
MGFATDLKEEHLNYIQESIIKNISGNISVLQMICYIVFSKYNDVELIKVEVKQKVEHKVTFERNKPQAVKLQVANFINRNERKR